jgi:hypothetical protein
MEHFFTPTRRLRDRHDNYISDEMTGYTQVQLAVSIEAFMNHRWNWSDFQAFVTGDEQGEMGKILWITEHAFIWVEDENTALEFYLLHNHTLREHASFTAPSGETHVLCFAKVYGSPPLSAGASSVFWHAVTTSNCVQLKLEGGCSRFGLYSGPALLQFLTASPLLELLECQGMVLRAAYCLALSTLERTGLEVTFQECVFDVQQGAKDTFIEWLRHSQVVTKLERCSDRDIISALNGNSSVKSLITTSGCYEHELVQALSGNQGIENLRVLSLSAYTWSVLLRSLWAHPRIQSMSLGFFSSLSAASKTCFMNGVLQLVQCNTVVHTIDLPAHAKDEEFFQNSIVPRLEMNRHFFQDQRQALTRADPSVRGQLLGRALHIVRHNPDLLFRFLSENVPAFVRSDEEDPIISSGQKRKARP